MWSVQRGCRTEQLTIILTYKEEFYLVLEILCNVILHISISSCYGASIKLVCFTVGRESIREFRIVDR